MYLLKPWSQLTYTAGSLCFTFHYVSIKTDCETDEIISTYDFTFHYVSIKTLQTLYENILILPLHSIMYLLKLFELSYFRERRNHFTFHYVSIKTAFQKFVIYIVQFFTFHYVSIKTVYKSMQEIIDNITLHSIMYLLKLTGKKEKRILK